MSAFILSVGDELVAGLTVDTNSAWLSRELASAGVSILGHAAVGDDRTALKEAISAHVGGLDVLLITGGLGPTPDDVTREALAEVMKVPLVERSDWLEHLMWFFAARRRTMPNANRRQALIPSTAQLLWNPTGTASGIAADLPSGPKQAAGETSCRIFVLPGVPAEMMAMFEQHIRPWLREQVQRRGGRVIRRLALHTFGLGESDVAARLGDLLRRREEAEGLQVGTTASGGMVCIRAYASGISAGESEAKLAAVEGEARQKLGDMIFGRNEETMASVVGRLLREHRARPLLRVAESCTGGLLGKLITDIPGSSDYFDRGFITYANDAKLQMLGVTAGLIEAHGAVSEEVAAAMATGALAGLPPGGRAGIALSISGIAGPVGGTPQKPVGTVCIGLATGGLAGDSAAVQATARTFHFVGDRDMIRQRSAMMALATLRYHLLEAPMPF